MSQMRRKEKEIKEKVVLEEVLRENQVGRLGTAVDGRPYIVPMNFVYTKGKIILHTHKDGKKVKDIEKNPRVCFEVDGGEMVEGDDPCNYSWRYRSVIANGTAKIVKDPELKLKALRLLSDKYAFGKGQKLDLEKISKFKDLWIIEISVDEMTGKKSPA
ncbi:pyridoxamine 5'-phosphate oxidase family protein [Candidatus Bathyarchaeota archaeon]|nr:pyridoxamine 5'-phosphate oxidase family protein [Candidatus Bathyarchaeota archaeon]